MNCTLFIPHLIPPRELGEALWRTVDAPQLKTLLARAAFTRDPAVDAETWLCDAFGIARQQDFPLAPLLAAHENLDAGSGYWLCAPPVHLETRRNALVLTDPAALEITAAESAAFTATLANHLREENVALYAPQPGLWFLRSNTTPAMTTSSIGTVSGRDVRSFLPQGPDSARWHRVLTEIQMLLHSHPVNDAREAAGRLPVNSVWLWGGGTLPAPSPAVFDAVWSDDATVRALAQYCGCRVEQKPDRVTAETLKGKAHFFSLESLEGLMRQGDVQAWSSAVSALNRDWFMPLLDALKSHRLNTLTIVSSSDAGTQQFVIRRNDLLKFWRNNKYLQ